MIFRFYKDKQNTFVFQASSCESAKAFILKHCQGLSENSKDGSDWVGNYISIIATQNDNPPFRPLFVVEEPDPHRLVPMPGAEGDWGRKHWGNGQ